MIPQVIGIQRIILKFQFIFSFRVFTNATLYAVQFLFSSNFVIYNRFHLPDIIMTQWSENMF